MRLSGRRQFRALRGGAALGLGASCMASWPADPPAPPEPTDEEIDNPKRGSGQVVWSVDTDRPIAALTFDDGPHPALTTRVLEILDRYQVPASFFMMGHCRSEEHTSELQSLMRISYAVFCLKKKKNTQIKQP